MALRRYLMGFLMAAGFGLLALSPASAATMPSAQEQEVLVKSSLMTFNDANLTGDYSVFHAKTAKPFRDQFSADQLKKIFQEFATKKIDISGSVVKPLKPSEDAKIDDGVLILNGTIAITDTYVVTYAFKFLESEGQWKVVGLNVKT